MARFKWLLSSQPIGPEPTKIFKTWNSTAVQRKDSTSTWIPWLVLRHIPYKCVFDAIMPDYIIWDRITFAIVDNSQGETFQGTWTLTRRDARYLSDCKNVPSSDQGSRGSQLSQRLPSQRQRRRKPPTTPARQLQYPCLLCGRKHDGKRETPLGQEVQQVRKDYITISHRNSNWILAPEKSQW